MTEQRADYDNPWKDALSLYFPAFMAFFFPEIDANIDWNRGYEFLDKELQQITPDAEIGSREKDCQKSLSTRIRSSGYSKLPRI
jgi:hypothetical protein